LRDFLEEIEKAAIERSSASVATLELLRMSKVKYRRPAGAFDVCGGG